MANASPEGAPGELGQKIKLLFKRAFRTDLDPIQLLPDEHVPIEVERVHGDSEPLRRVLLWRRAALLVALLFQIPPTFVSMIKTFIALGEQGGANDLEGVLILPLFANIALIVAMFVAYKRWDRWVRSRKILYWAWVIAFVGPFLLWLIPLRAVQGGGGQAVLVGFVAGLFVIIDLGPKVLALIPALMRSAIVTKTVLPQSQTPGWIMLLAAPFYLMLLYMLLLTPYQLAGGSFFAPALILLMASPVFMWRAGKQLARPSDLESVTASVRSLRVTTLITNALGGLFLFIGLIDVFGELKAFGPLDTILPLIQMVANVFLLSIVGLDLMLPTLARNHLAQKSPEHAEAWVALESELDAIAAATDVEPPPSEHVAPPPKPVATPKPVAAPKPAAPKPVAAKPPAPAGPKPLAPIKPPPPRVAAPAPKPEAAPSIDPNDDPLASTQPGGPPRE
ncbi:MAG: hypothetical protein IT385_28930 [Deltaproteobacteria bacterium]|nr:hypothetical protein [Deltaproteobacteria bacterium]